MRRLFYLLISVLLLSGCKGVGTTIMQEGTWRATLHTESGKEIPFNFRLTNSQDQKPVIEIINGDERLKVDDIVFQEDSVLIKMPFFDSEFRGHFEGDAIKGVWVKHLADKDVAMNFVAEPDTYWRFIESKIKAKADVTGRWATTFASDKDSSFAIGEFVQKGSKLTGTFLTTTGDYRFLEGTVANNEFYLSCFDGTHAYLFTGKIEEDKIVNGKFYAGLNHVEDWCAVKNDSAVLPDAYSLTKLKEGQKKLDFAYPNLNKHIVSSKDEKFKNKVVIVQLLGSWCPNCMDETKFLSDFYKQYKGKGVEIVGLAFERTADFERSKKSIMKFKDRFDVQYDLLVTNKTSDSKQRNEALPMLDKIMGFPTTIIIDKNGEVRKIHTGFSGPGTGKHYDDFVKEFTKYIDELIAEPVKTAA
ncbi:peroxiredoxin family protein [Solitalea canadensis]|uniref:Peroxiredoxin n=1 Tax=Solitalea canadensis (strain ATCC 29591 / DSM 3403 / JCM 21819 / LMG 8368 / NBRC 15130 / NCIMB 12057 / USAM 9D) TaxID=929556 RepID=H8KXG6_SOLCM|nr:TlpA disulfide reductase family protein [Solitalea canadensis]AFD08495.1 Peroxiredoxin [Solitalea canadensis DSM 3403]